MVAACGKPGGMCVGGPPVHARITEAAGRFDPARVGEALRRHEGEM